MASEFNCQAKSPNLLRLLMTDKSAQSHSADSDVRMRGFSRRTTVDDAIAWLDAHSTRLPSITVPLAEAAGRVLAERVVSDVDVPGFDRAMMDGFAVQAEQVAGATPYNQQPLEIVGASFPGRPFEATVGRGQAVRIMTGAPLPDGANAVLPAEVARVEGEVVHALGEVSPGKHVGNVGEDVVRGATVLESGRQLRPQDLGVLSSIGAAQVACVRCPRVCIIVTGNEVLPAGTRPRPNEIVDANGPMLESLARRDGADIVHREIVPDDRARIGAALETDAEVAIVSGGSSVGQEDFVPSIVAERGELAVHGVAMRPSSPTGMGRIGGMLVFLLPGNPVSCLCAYDFFAGRAIRRLGGRSGDWPYRTVRAPLAEKISSVVGRLDYARVVVQDDGVRPLAIGGASVLTSTTRADGFVLIPSDSEGFPEGSIVDVYLYD